MKKLYTIIFIVFLMSISGKLFSQNATFFFTNTGTNPQMDSAITFAGNIWGQYLNSAVPIKIHLYYMNLFGTTLAITVPNGRRDFPSAPVDSVWYASCLANSIEGVELNPGEDDINIFFDNNVTWYLGVDANCPGGQYDFVSTLLHEIGHGLGFLSLSKLQGDTLGSFGAITTADISPLVTTFPFPNLQGKHSIFSHYMQNGSAQSLVDTSLFPNPSNILGSQFKSGAVYFNGPLAMAANGGNPVRLYAPTTYASGSSMEHLNEATFPPSNPNTMMTPFQSMSQEQHTPGPITLAILKDIGWNVNLDVSVENLVSDLRLEVFPNPVQSHAVIRLDQSLESELLEVFDLYGHAVISQKISIQQNTFYAMDFSTLSPGLYLVKVKDGMFKLIKN